MYPKCIQSAPSQRWGVAKFESDKIVMMGKWVGCEEGKHVTRLCIRRKPAHYLPMAPPDGRAYLRNRSGCDGSYCSECGVSNPCHHLDVVGEIDGDSASSAWETGGWDNSWSNPEFADHVLAIISELLPVGTSPGKSLVTVMLYSVPSSG